MKRFEIVFIKDNPVININKSTVILIKQGYFCPDNGNVDIKCPVGFRIHTITEILPDLDLINKPEKNENLLKN